MPNTGLNNNSTSRRQKTAVFVSPTASPTRYRGTSHLSNTLQKTSAAGFSPSDGNPTSFSTDVTEAAKRSRTLPLPSANKYLAEHDDVSRVGSSVDGPSDVAAYGVTPKSLSRDELVNTDLDIGSMVEFDIGSERHYGVIRWIGFFYEKRNVIVGIELVNDCRPLLFSVLS